jgi:hypothetical protein
VFWRIASGLVALALFVSCEKKPPECRSIRDMKVCEETQGCKKSSVWVIGLPDAKPLPEHHQYECVAKEP